MPTVIVEVEKAGGEMEHVNDYIGQLTWRRISDGEGQARLDELIDDGSSPEEINKRFWEETYFQLNGEAQKRFQQQLFAVTGFEPGDVIAIDKEGRRIRAKDWHDIAENADLGNKAEYLEGIERGYVVLMDEANRRMPETSSVKPQLAVAEC